jgi:hypothetical protein
MTTARGEDSDLGSFATDGKAPASESQGVTALAMIAAAA